MASALLPTKEMLTNSEVQLHLAGELDEFGAGLVGPDEDHRFGIALADREQRGLDRDRVALEAALGGEFHAALVERPLDAFEAGAAEGVVLVENGDATDVAVLGEPLDHHLGLLEIGGAHVDDVGDIGIAQEFGAGEGAHEGQAGLARDRRRGLRGRRADRADQREDLVLADQLLGRLDRLVGFVAVVAGDERELAPLDPARRIGLGEGGEQSRAHPLSERRSRSVERRGLSEQDRVGAHARLGESRRRERREAEQRRGEDSAAPGAREHGVGQEREGAEHVHLQKCRDPNARNRAPPLFTRELRKFCRETLTNRLPPA